MNPSKRRLCFRWGWSFDEFGPIWFFRSALTPKIPKPMATQAELVTTLNQTRALLDKTFAEIGSLLAQNKTLTDKVKECEEANEEGVEVTAELNGAVASVRAQAEIVDNLIQDIGQASR